MTLCVGIQRIGADKKTRDGSNEAESCEGSDGVSTPKMSVEQYKNK